jgi:hypothetical protein
MKDIFIKRYKRHLFSAIFRARIPILQISVVNVLSVLIGIIMVHSEVQYSIKYRDKLVVQAYQKDAASISHKKGDNLRAAMIDFSMNLFTGAIPLTISGLSVIPPYAISGFRGWVGGIVSIDGSHSSRFRTFNGALYYTLALLLQLVPYSLSGGMGVYLGLSFFRKYKDTTIKKLLGLPKEALMDVFYVYILISILFLIASLWEFLSPLNN